MQKFKRQCVKSSEGGRIVRSRFVLEEIAMIFASKIRKINHPGIGVDATVSEQPDFVVTEGHVALH